jgi:hypothetical protein
MVAATASARGRTPRRVRLRARVSAAAALVLVLVLVLVPAAAGARAEGPTNTVAFSCTGVTFAFSGFPNAPGNVVTEFIQVDGTVVYSGEFSFSGPSGSNTVPISLSPGHHEIDGRTRWNTNGVRGGKDTPARGGLTCIKPAPGFSIVKSQRIAGGSEGFAGALLIGEIGQTVDYQIVVTNTGNVPLTFKSFADPGCDAGTLTGGPAGPVAAEESTTYLCSHVLAAVGSYSNTATATGSPPLRNGAPITHESNTVLAEVPSHPDFSIEKLQEIAGGAEGFTASPLTGAVGQTVDYEINVTNTGNVPLHLGVLEDGHCDAGTISGGPGELPLARGATTRYFCHHVLAATGSYSNAATISATPLQGEGSPITHTSGTVVVNVPGESPPGKPTPPPPTVRPAASPAGSVQGLQVQKPPARKAAAHKKHRKRASNARGKRSRRAPARTPRFTG